MADNESRQRDEVAALVAILGNESVPEVFTDGQGRSCGQLVVAPIVPGDFVLKVVETGTGDQAGSCLVSEEHQVDFLPPFTLDFVLPPDYPARNPPEYTLRCKWITNAQVSQLCAKMDSLWLQGQFSEILFVWYDFLHTDSLVEMGIRDCMSVEDARTSEHSQADGPRAGRDVIANAEAADAILEYDAEESRRRFGRTIFSCGVCLQERAGKFCTRYGACKNHTFCRECTTRHLTFCITSGSVLDLACPADSCRAAIHPAQVKELVPDLYEKYERLLLQTTLDSMPDIIYCPRPHCQGAVICEGETKIASCPSCRYAFCRLCKKTFHGVSLCSITSDVVVEIERQHLLRDRTALAKLEEQYGERAVQRVLQRLRQGEAMAKSKKVLTQQWIGDHCKKCPGCRVNIEKAAGCNKMTCSKCGLLFCWHCNKQLDGPDPYDHFRLSPECE